MQARVSACRVVLEVLPFSVVTVHLSPILSGVHLATNCHELQWH